MSNAIVKYDNDSNKIQLPIFTEQEQNLLFSIVSRIKETNGKNIRLFWKDSIVDIESMKYFTKIMDSLRDKFLRQILDV